MEEYTRQQQRSAPPRRRKRSQLDIFKEDYLPAVIVCVALILIVIFIVGSISRAVQYKKLEQSGNGTSLSQEELKQAAQDAVAQARAYAGGFDYEKAIAALDAYPGKLTEEMNQLKKEYGEKQKELVLWEDNSSILHLSFRHLIADPVRAFANGNYDSHLTVTEFTKILQQLYENDYILISLEDIVQETTNDAGDTILTAKELYLPMGKKPLLLTQNDISYSTAMVDSDDDKFPDEKAPGFANRLLLDENGNLACEFISSDGSTITGAYDLVPVLDSFITTHQDFSYKGAKAILAVNGYDGLFGYRTTVADGDYFGPAYRDKQISQASAVIDALRRSGYVLACSTYGDIAYGTGDAGTVSADLESWNNEVVPVLGETDILVFAKDSDIASAETAYSGDKYSTLAAQGFSYYLGASSNGDPWQMLGDGYLRQGRVTVSADTIRNNADWFTGVFDAATILESGR